MTTESRRRWEEAHREALRAYHRAWSKANRDKVKAYAAATPVERRRELARKRMAAWRKKNPERAKAVARKAIRVSNERYPDKRPARVKAWHAANPGAKQVIEQRREARKRNAPGAGVTKEQWNALVADYGGRCAYCAKVAKMTMDHVEPIAKGGAHDINNIVPACRNCNSQKHDNTIVLWLAKRAAA